MTEKYDTLKLENQLCFPLYACSKEVIKRYKPLLDQLDLTYTQYIAMLVLWDKKEINVCLLIFLVVVFWPAAVIYAIVKMSK